MSKIKKMCEPLSSLYGRTDLDWVLEVSVILTEPVCPVAVIRADDPKWEQYPHCSGAFGDTFEQAIEHAISHVMSQINKRWPDRETARD